MKQDAEARLLEKLQMALHGVAAPFSCDGTYRPEHPVALVFKDKTRFEVIRAEKTFDQPNLLKPLLDRCRPAPFGDGKKTRFNRSIRDALQLKAENGAFKVEKFDPESAGILKEIHDQLVPHDPHPLVAELDGINIYRDGGHFAAHKDTPRGGDMIGTLVVCLPSQFGGGAFTLTHRGVVKRYDWGTDVRTQKHPDELQWAAFFGDVDHSIERIWSGARVTVTYLLRRGAGSPGRAAVQENPKVHEIWKDILADKEFMPEGGTLAYPCCHLYHQDARFQEKQKPISEETATMLKGRDHLVASSALEMKLKVSFHPYLFEDCCDDTWLLDRFPTRQEKARLRSRMDPNDLEQTLPIRANLEMDDGYSVTWLEEPPTHGSSSKEKEERDREKPAAALLHHCEYSQTGYFGNEGSDVDFYTYAALHIRIPAFGKGVRKPKKSRNQPAAKARGAVKSRKKPSP